MSRYIVSSLVLLVPLPAAAQGHGATEAHEVADAHGAAGGHDAEHESPFPKIGFHTLNFVLLVGLLVWLVGGRIRDALADRATTIRREIEDAQKMRQDSISRYEQIQAQLAGLQGQVAQMRADAEREAAAEAQAIAARAERDAQLIAEAAERTIRDETLRARQSLRREAAALAVKLASEQLQHRVSAGDNARLNQEFLTAVRNGASSLGSKNHG